VRIKRIKKPSPSSSLLLQGRQSKEKKEKRSRKKCHEFPEEEATTLLFF